MRYLDNMADGDDDSFSLDDLAERTGFDRRVIRSFIEQGLMRGPDSMGRYARYSRSHLQRLKAIRVLKDTRGLAISEVRQALMSMTDLDIQSLATHDVENTPQSSSSALAYLRAIQQPDANVKPLAHSGKQYTSGAVPTSCDDAQRTTLDKLIVEFDRMLPGKRVRKQAKGAPSFHIDITPDIELVVKGTHTEEQLARLERIADYMREILLGGLEDE